MTAGAERKLRWPGFEVRLVILCGFHSHMCLLQNHKAECYWHALTCLCGASCSCGERHHRSLAIGDQAASGQLSLDAVFIYSFSCGVRQVLEIILTAIAFVCRRGRQRWQRQRG